MNDLRRSAIDLCNWMPPTSISRREGSIDGNHAQSDDECPRVPSQQRQRVEATCASERKGVIVLNDSDSDDDHKQSSPAPISSMQAFIVSK